MGSGQAAKPLSPAHEIPDILDAPALKGVHIWGLLLFVDKGTPHTPRPSLAAMARPANEMEAARNLGRTQRAEGHRRRSRFDGYARTRQSGYTRDRVDACCHCDFDKNLLRQDCTAKPVSLRSTERGSPLSSAALRSVPRKPFGSVTSDDGRGSAPFGKQPAGLAAKCRP